MRWPYTWVIVVLVVVAFAVAIGALAGREPWRPDARGATPGSSVAPAASPSTVDAAGR